MIVICVNDYPYCVLPLGTTEDEAEQECRRLEEEEKERTEIGYSKVYYHWHDAPVHEAGHVPSWLG